MIRCVTEHERMLRRALIVRRVAARKQSDAQRRIWVERRQRERERVVDDEDADRDERFESAGSPDADLSEIPEL